MANFQNRTLYSFWLYGSSGKSCIHEGMEIDVDRSSIALEYKE